jgi:hypothetical protein
MFLRHLLSILLLSFVVVVLVPYALLEGAPAQLELSGNSPWPVLRVIGGAALFVGGSGLFMWSVDLFARIGRGTLAP